ncbi:MAG TPA: acetate/propionate family kinase [Verrucomicrobiae bacterium]|jgi:acetate kinase|nr:acetate/propionate family kinase [Verrucomicrobiae bacterium]
MSASETILVINGGSSSIKFSVYSKDDPASPILSGKLERIGSGPAGFQWRSPRSPKPTNENVDAPDHKAGARFLIDWIERRPEAVKIAAVGHRVVHGGPKYSMPQRVTPDLIAELERIGRFDPEHSPGQLQLISIFQERLPGIPQITCFDTAFHQTMPRVAKILPLPRKYDAKGVRRYGFHGLSFTFLVEELERLAGPAPARGRVILAHLGNGASLAAVRDGKSVDTSMGFTPTAGIPMSSRTGDMDPGVFSYLCMSEGVTPEKFGHIVNAESGLLGISETSSDMRDLLAREAEDVRAAEAIDVFCYQTRKWIGAFAAVLGGVETLVFAGGIGENVPVVRERICAGLEFLGITVDPRENAANAAVISPKADGGATVRVIPTNEELVIAKAVWRLLSQ